MVTIIALNDNKNPKHSVHFTLWIFFSINKKGQHIGQNNIAFDMFHRKLYIYHYS